MQRSNELDIFNLDEGEALKSEGMAPMKKTLDAVIWIALGVAALLPHLLPYITR